MLIYDSFKKRIVSKGDNPQFFVLFCCKQKRFSVGIDDHSVAVNNLKMCIRDSHQLWHTGIVVGNHEFVVNFFNKDVWYNISGRLT